MFAWLAAGFMAGVVARRVLPLPAAAPDAINTYIIYLALPAVILLRVPTLTLDANALVPVGMAWLVILGSAAAVLAIARRHGWPAEITGALLMVVPLSNSAYVGIPVIDAVTSGAATSYAILYDQLGSFVALSIYGSIVMAVFGGSQEVSVASVIRRIALFPPFVVLLLALAMPPDVLPAAALSALEMLGYTMGPSAMFIVGLQLELTVVPALRRPLLIGLFLSLVFAPALALGAMFTLGGGEAARAAALQAAMPPMITAALLAMAAGFSRPLTIAMVGLGSLCSLITVPLVVWIARLIV